MPRANNMANCFGVRRALGLDKKFSIFDIRMHSGNLFQPAILSNFQ